MTKNPRNLALLTALAAVMLPGAAQAQYYGSAAPPPLYPYAVQNSYGVQTSQPYAIQVAPNTYVIKRPAASRNYPYVHGHSAQTAAEPKTKRFDRPPKPADRALIEELRQRHSAKSGVVNTTKIVREKPVVIETRRVVDDPPRIIERHFVAEDEPVRKHRKRGIIETPEPNYEANNGASHDDTKKRVIEADAEVTILGPDRMSIRLFRKGQGPKAKARAN